MSPSERAEIAIELSSLFWTEKESLAKEDPQKWARWEALGNAWRKRMNESA
jgi:hypothetical protein